MVEYFFYSLFYYLRNLLKIFGIFLKWRLLRHILYLFEWNFQTSIRKFNFLVIWIKQKIGHDCHYRDLKTNTIHLLLHYSITGAWDKSTSTFMYKRPCSSNTWAASTAWETGLELAPSLTSINLRNSSLGFWSLRKVINKPPSTKSRCFPLGFSVATTADWQVNPVESFQV